MSKTIVIGNNTVVIPESGDSADWGQGVSTALEDLASSLSSIVGPFDVALQSFNIDSFNPGLANTALPSLKFPTALFPAVEIKYAVYRDTSSVSAYEEGTLNALYQNGTSPVWLLSRTYIGDSSIAFDINTSGQVTFTCSTLAGTGHTGKIVYKATVVVTST